MSEIIKPFNEPNAPVEVPVGTFPYGWDATVATRKVPGLVDVHGKEMEEQLPFPKFYKKIFTHPMRSFVVGAPKRGGVASTWTPPQNRRKTIRHNECKPTRYIVWHDMSLRSVEKIIRKQIEGLTPEQQAEFIGGAMANK